MMFRKTISAAMASMLFAAAAGAVSAQTAEPAEKPLPNFMSFSGTIKEIKKPEAQDAGYKEIILAENADGGETAFKITDDTYFVTDKKAETGVGIIGFYDGKAPMTLQYPPSPTARVIAIGFDKDKFIKVDRFDKDLISEDGQLKLNIGAGTKIILQNSEDFNGELEGRALVVIYGKTTRSIPAQTTPDEIIVLYEKAAPPIHMLTDEEKAAQISGDGTVKPVTPIYELTEEDKAALAKASKNLSVNVNDQAAGGPKPYVNENGVFMLPVRAVAEAMSLKVEWFGDTNTVQVGKSASFVIGKNAYAKNKMAPVELDAAPVLKNNAAYVPLNFFTQMLEHVEVRYTPESIEFHIPLD